MTFGNRSFRRRRAGGWIFALLIILVLVARFLHRNQDKVIRPIDGVPVSEGIFEMVRIVDGDTLVVREPAGDDPRLSKGGPFKVRLLGIDCPETVKRNHPVEPWGPESSEFSRDFVSGGQVRLRFDRRRVDQYGRHLAYVYVGDRMLNAELVRAGLARVSTYPGDSESMARKLRSAEGEARREGRGIWSGKPPGP